MRKSHINIMLIATLLLGGCTLPGTVAGLNEAQINALVKMKDAGAMCITGSGPPMTGGGSVVTASIDRGIKGSIKVGPDCAVEINTQ